MELTLKPKGKGMEVTIGGWELDGYERFMLAEEVEAYVGEEKVELPTDEGFHMRGITEESFQGYCWFRECIENEFVWNGEDCYKFEVGSLDDVKLLVSKYVKYGLGEFENFPVMMIANYIMEDGEYSSAEEDEDWC